jgi:hypothetical protein
MRIPLNIAAIAALVTPGPSASAQASPPSGPAAPAPSHPGETPLTDAPALVFLHHKDVNPAMWGKKVPTYDNGSVRWYFLTYRLVVPHGAVMFLKASGEAGTESQCQEVLDHFRRIASQDLDRVRRKAILRFVNQFLTRMGLDSVDAVTEVPKVIVEAVALMFDVGQSTVQKLLPKPVEKADTSYKSDERWVAVKQTVQLARVYAHKLALQRPLGGRTVGSLKTESVLLEAPGPKTGPKTLLFPQVCPVLGIELSYDYFMDRKSPNMIRVGRIVPSKPFETGNVLLMSTKAFHALETRSAPEALKAPTGVGAKSGARTKPEMVLDEHEQESFDRWCRKHGI